MYHFVSAGFFLALFGIWSKDGWFNVAIKLACLGLGVWGIVVALQ